MNLKIQVIGACNTGKTTIAQEIKQHLGSLGIKTTLVDKFNDPNAPAAHHFKLNVLKEKQLIVNIETIQVQHNNGCLNIMKSLHADPDEDEILTTQEDYEDF